MSFLLSKIISFWEKDCPDSQDKDIQSSEMFFSVYNMMCRGNEVIYYSIHIFSYHLRLTGKIGVPAFYL